MSRFIYRRFWWIQSIGFVLAAGMGWWIGWWWKGWAIFAVWNAVHIFGLEPRDKWYRAELRTRWASRRQTG